MNDAYFGYDKKPSYVIKDTFIKVILPNVLFDDANMNDEHRVLNLIDIKLEITRQDVENLLGFNKAKAIDIINKLIQNNVIEPQETGKNIVYKKT